MQSVGKRGNKICHNVVRTSDRQLQLINKGHIAFPFTIKENPGETVQGVKNGCNYHLSYPPTIGLAASLLFGLCCTRFYCSYVLLIGLGDLKQQGQGLKMALILL